MQQREKMKIKISKVSVNKTLEGQWSIVFNLKITDDEGKTELLTQNFTEDYKTEMELSNVGDKTQKAMQFAIDSYKKEQQILSDNKLDAIVANIQNNLIT
jgi:hypothetical protein